MPSSETTTTDPHVRGIYERDKGSNVWWIRFADADGRIRRERAGTKSTAKKLYQYRKAQIMSGKKLPPNLRTKPVLFKDLTDDALSYAKTHKRSYADDERNMPLLTALFGDEPAAGLTPKRIETGLL